jgi:hypothetical protein
LSAEDVMQPPGIEAALRLLETGDGNGLVAANEGRLSRLVCDLSALIATAQKQGWALVALDCALHERAAGEPAGQLRPV